ncbi:MAG TPA: hypothetical protein VMA55_17230 [Acidovorax sp.]|nr:hypothetical protein [Acidovorax sp.]
MSQNRIELRFTADALQNIDTAIATLENELAGLIALTPDERRELTKMGEKSEAFCRQAVNVLSENSGVLPRNFDLPGYQSDLTALDALRPRTVRLRRLGERLADTEMALGSDLMTGSLEGYASLKLAGKGEGLDALRKMLSARFSRGPRTETPTDPGGSGGNN